MTVTFSTSFGTISAMGGITHDSHSKFPSKHFTLFDLNGRELGSIILEKKDNKLKIFRLYSLREDFKGVGTYLLDRMITIRDADPLYQNLPVVLTSSATAILFYLRLGFENSAVKKRLSELPGNLPEKELREIVASWCISPTLKLSEDQIQIWKKRLEVKEQLGKLAPEWTYYVHHIISTYLY